ncbi:MAG: acetyl-CoA carboxylase carboxyltransferase subunit alpha, partial [Gammaproteobacteria bacterium]|nr:acetyl-CoA carboxylase carboxyltransferase subunit alpha [Gammaproteobacteria bacterium]
LRNVTSDNRLDITQEIRQLEKKHSKLIQSIYTQLSPWQITQLARHPQRPYTLDYIKALFTDFEELHGDRRYADDAAMITGIARFKGLSVVVVGHQKGRDTQEKVKRNFGMCKPEGYRKAKRIFELAERFKLPVLTFIDTPGAYPGIDAEERNQSEAIATNLKCLAKLEVPVICTVIGEGGSGGALAIGVGDYLIMLQYSIYSVISPEGCASILWKDAAYANVAAKALKLTADELRDLGLIDEVVAEVGGGAHRNFEQTHAKLSEVLESQLKRLTNLSTEQLLATRYKKWADIGYYKDV